MKEKSKKLVANTILFTIGSFGSKLIQFILLPLYTYALNTSEFGTADLVTTTINFLIPIFSIQMSDGLLRFGLDKKEKQEDVINCAVKVVTVGSFISILLAPLFIISDVLKQWIAFFLIIMILRIYRDIFAIVLKIKDKNKLFATDSILYTLVLCISSIVFLTVFRLGVTGYFISYIVANVFSIIFTVTASRINIRSIFKKTDDVLCKKIVIYSLPLIVNSMAYWIVTAFDRYMINWFMGEDSVGIYAVAAKIPAILSTITSIFSQAWLISSINEYETERDTSFYTSMLRNYCQLSFIACSVLILFIRPFIHYYVSSDFYEAWAFSPFLILSAVFSGICSFLNGIYYAYKRNVSTTITTTIGALLNIALNFILIPRIGILGASIATAVSWGIIVVLKLGYLSKFINISISYWQLFLSVVLIIMEILIQSIENSLVGTVIDAILTISVITINYGILLTLLTISKRKIARGSK